MKIQPNFFNRIFRFDERNRNELAPSITAILFNEIDSKKVNLMSKGLLAGCNQFFMTKGLL
jgi:hypothetical protein